MPVCIVAATASELNNVPYKGADILIAGLGSAATIYNMMKYLRDQKPSLFIQAGIAGSFDENMPLGTAVVVTADRFADLGVQENGQWKDVFDLELAQPGDHPFAEGWLNNPHNDLLHALQLPLVRSITINEVTTASHRIQQLNEKYGAAIESMEGAAFHYVCLQERIPFVQLRTVSNYIGERNKDKWQLKQATNTLSEHLQAVVSKFAKDQ